MHVTGKILVFLVAVGAIGALVLSARLVDARGKWMNQLQEARKQNEANADKLAAARLARDQAREQLEREMLRWDRIWNNVNGTFFAQNKSLVVNLGASAGIEPKLNLYAFQVGNNNASSYVGAFTASKVQPNNAGLNAAFRVRADDVPNWSGQLWRIRSMIPSAYASQVASLETELVVADELLAKQTGNLETQNKLVEEAREQRDARTAELLGGGKADAATPGLVAQITQAEDKRNESLAKVDELRRAISAATAAVQQLIRENNELVRARTAPSLPKVTALSAPRT